MSHLRTWLAFDLPDEVARALERHARRPEVRCVCVMPDVHLAKGVCVGTVTATEETLFPAAVGGDIGCGMAALPLRGHAELSASSASDILEKLREHVPIVRRAAPLARPALFDRPLRHPRLQKKTRDLLYQLGTVGRGNHFVELQREDGAEGDGWWLLVHSGSRGLGPAIRDVYAPQLHAASTEGQAYLADHDFARAFATLNRTHLLRSVAHIVFDVLGLEPRQDAAFENDHNHVAREVHVLGGSRTALWVHRKGAQRARAGDLGVVPGSMGTSTFHIEGRGDARSLTSAAHGAGRVLSRSAARQTIGLDALATQLEGVFVDPRRRHQLRDEAPAAYKDIVRVMRAQRKLVRILRRLRPRLVYK